MKRKRARREEVKRNALVQSINRRDEKRSLAPNNLKAELRSCLEKKTRGFATIPSPRTHSATLATAREKAVSVAPCVTRSAAWAPHRTGEKKRRSRWAMCVVLEPPPLRDTPARGRPARARHPPLVAVPLCYAPAMMAVFAARKSILGIAESDADPAPRLPPRPQLDARLPPELRWISALCSSAYFQPCERHEPAGGKEKEKGELTNFFARDTGETLCPSCVGGRDVVQVRLRFRRDFAGGHTENPSAKATTPPRARTPALARAAARKSGSRWTRCFLASSRETRGSVVFRFSQVLPRWRFVSCELGRALCRAPVSTQCGALESPGARPRGEASLGTPPHRPARSRAVPGPGCDARAARPTAPTPLSRRPSRRLVHDRGKELVFPMTVS